MSVVVPSTPGVCFARWEMFDSRVREMFPGARLMIMLVRVEP